MLGCELGQVKYTDGFRLPARYVLHTVGPTHGESSTYLKFCYVKCLDKAKELGIQSVAFPSISGGTDGLGAELAAKIALSTVQRWLSLSANNGKLDEVVFALISKEEEALYKQTPERSRNTCNADGASAARNTTGFGNNDALAATRGTHGTARRQGRARHGDTTLLSMPEPSPWRTYDRSAAEGQSTTPTRGPPRKTTRRASARGKAAKRSTLDPGAPHARNVGGCADDEPAGTFLAGG